MIKTMYDEIKKQNGEAFAKAIQRLDERIFSLQDLKWMLRYAGRNPMPVLPLLRHLAQEQEGQKKSDKNPIELLKKAGYEAFYVETKEQKEALLKYFAPQERMLVTRLDDYLKYYHVIHAVQKGAEKLKREDFKNPFYDDAYAKSVISIQISKEKEKDNIHIENRYGGYGPTYNQNPDNIIAGLKDALEKKFDCKLSQMSYLMPKFYLFEEDRLVHYSFEKKGIYFGDQFYYKNGIVYELDKDYQCLIDTYLFDLKEKKVINVLDETDRFARILTNEMNGKVVQKKKEKEGFSLYLNGERFISCDKESAPLYLRLFKAKNLPSSSIRGGLELKEGIYEELKIGWNSLRVFIGDNLQKVGANCFNLLQNLEVFQADKLRKIGWNCFCYTFKEPEERRFDQVVKMGEECFSSLRAKSLSFKRLKVVPRESFCYLNETESLCFDEAVKINANAIYLNKNLKRLSASKVKEIYWGAVKNNQALEEINFRSVETLYSDSVSRNQNLKTAILSSLEEIEGHHVLSYNHPDMYLEAPCLKEISDDLNVKEVYAPLLNIENKHIKGKKIRTGKLLKAPKRMKQAQNLIKKTKESQGMVGAPVKVLSKSTSFLGYLKKIIKGNAHLNG